LSFTGADWEANIHTIQSAVCSTKQPAFCEAKIFAIEAAKFSAYQFSKPVSVRYSVVASYTTTERKSNIATNNISDGKSIKKTFR